MAADRRWRLDLFAGLRAESDGMAVTRFRTEKTGLLLAYLACRRGRGQSREALVELLWPDFAPDAGRNYLSKAVSSLRRQLEPEGARPGSVIVADRVTIALGGDALTTDVAEFEAAIEASRRVEGLARIPSLERAIELYRGEFLLGYHHDWIPGERARLGKLFLRAAHELFLLLQEARESPRALACARRAVAAAPLDEAASRDLMTACNAAGDFAATLRQYGDIERRLERELGVAPERATRELARAAEVARATRAQKLRPGHGHERESLFVGREEELASTSRALLEEGARVVTLLGPGGVGKTRLALEFAERHADDFAGAVFFASLAEISSPTLMPTVIRDAMRLERSAREPQAQVLAALSARRTLLVLDNLEHMASAGAKLVRALIDGAPELRCLVTSRRRLPLDASRNIQVRPLPVPKRAGSRAHALELASVRLFVEQAQAVRPGFAITDENAREVADLVHDLEGYPLALLLAASRMRLSSPGELRARLKERLDLLRDRRASRPARHRTLRAAISSNFDLLAPESRLFFSRLAVFRGGFDLDAAERVCEDPHALDRLADLDECSLVQVERRGEDARFRMLETIREYAWERIAAADRRALGRRHAESALALVKETLAAPDAPFHRLERELDNIRAALEWFRDDREGGEGLIQLVTRLPGFWTSCGYASEGHGWLAEARARAAGGAPLSDVRLAQGYLSWTSGDYAAAEAAYAEALALRRSLGDRGGVAQTLTRLGSVHGSKGDIARAIACHEESLALSREIGDRRAIALALGNFGNALRAAGDFRRARSAVEESIGLLREQRDRSNLLACLRTLGLLALEQGDHAVARAYLEECLGSSRDMGDTRGAAHALLSLGLLDAALGDACAADERLLEALASFEELGNRYGAGSALLGLGRSATASGRLAAARGFLDRSLQTFLEIASAGGVAVALQSLGALYRQAGDAALARSSYEASLRRHAETRERPLLPETLEGLAALERAEARADRAAILLGAASALREEIGIPLPPVGRKGHEELSIALRADLGPPAFEASLARGRALASDDIVAFALGKGDA